MIEQSSESGKPNGWAKLAAPLQALLWVAITLLAFASFLMYLETDGCLEWECEARIRRAWFPLMGVQALVVVGAVVVNTRGTVRTRLIVMSALAAVSVAAVFVYSAYV